MKYIILISCILFTAVVLAEKEFKTQEEKEASLVNFDSIKELLKKDLLEHEVKKKKDKIKVIQKKKTEKKVQRYKFPEENDFWPILNEYWLVKNARILKWDFNKPDYGLASAFTLLLETLGFYEIKFKILLLDTAKVTHMALPTGGDAYVLMVSVPFIRIMDLTKLEISILLLEDFFRAKSELFKNKIKDKALSDNFGSNFFGKKFDRKLLDDAMTKYDDLVYKKGFTFQEQFEVTRMVSDILKNNSKLWSAYNGLLKKIDHLVKSNLLYKDYNKIYPSPEMQIKWITPAEDELNKYN